MLQATVVGRRLRLTGCDDLRVAPYVASFPRFEGQPQFSMDMREVPERVVPFCKAVGRSGRMRWGELSDGRHILYTAPVGTGSSFSLFFDDGFSDVRLEMTSFSDAETLRYLYLSQCFGYYLLATGGCVLHSAGLKLGGAGIALAGASGVGKSTLAAAICAAEPTAVNLNDDSPALLERQDGFWLYGTPFCGGDTAFANDSAPLRAVVMLCQSGDNRLLPLSPQKALAELLSCLPRPAYYEPLCTVAADRAIRLVREVPLYRFENDGTTAAAETLLRELEKEHII